MKVKVIGSHLCEDTLYALCKLREKEAEFEYKDLSSSLPDLKEYLSVREHNALYDEVKAGGGIGIPFFELEDGTATLNLDEVLLRV